MRARWILAAVVALLALTGGTATAQGRGRGREKGPPPGQVRKAEREQAAFDEHEREVARNWWAHELRIRGGHEDEDENENENEQGEQEDQDERGGPPGHRHRALPPGLRYRDRLPPDLERELEPGWIVDPDDRQRLFQPPAVLIRAFTPPPPGFRYMSFGGHLLLLDAAFRVADVIHLELNVQR